MNNLFTSDQSIADQLGITEADKVEAGYNFDKNVRDISTADILPTVGSIVAMHPYVRGLQVVSKVAPYLSKLLGGAEKAEIAVSSALGAGVGRLGQQVADDELGLDTPVAVVQEVAETLAFDKAGDLIGQYGGSLLRISKTKVQEMFGKAPEQLTPSELTIAAQQMMNKHDTTLTEFSITGGGGLKEAVARGSLTTRGGMADADMRRMDAIESELSAVFNSKMSSEEFGLTFKKIYENTEEVVKGFFDKAYTNLDVLANGVKVPTKKLNRKYKELLDNRTKLGVSEEMLATLKSQFAGITPNGLSFKEAMTRTSLLKANLRAEKSKLNPNSSLTSLYRDGITDMESLLKDTSTANPELYTKYRKISKQYKEAKEALDDEVVTKALMGNPSQIAESIFKKGNVEQIQSFYKVLGSVAKKYNRAASGEVKELITEFQNGFIKGAFENVRVANTLAEKQGALRTIIESFDKEKFSRTYAQVFKGEPNRQRYMEVILKASERALDRPAGILTLLLSGKQSSAISGAVTGQPDWMGSMLLVLPSIVLRASNDPKRVNQLLKLDSAASKGGLTQAVASKVMQLAEDLGIGSSTPQKEEGQPEAASYDELTLEDIM